MKGESSATGVVPLRTILRNFLNLVENCESKRNGGLDSYDKEFQELKLFSESLKSDSGYMCKEGEKPVNRKKNRYKDILPFDSTRVILNDYGDIPGSDYINANFIKGASGSSAYIACQGPLPHTVNDFWRMVVECEVQVIVMACNEQESGKHKCENYWVEENGVERQFGQVTIWLKKCRSVCPDFLVRTMRIRFTNSAGENEERNVCQFHYSAWPDHGVPAKVRPLLDMVRLIRDCQTSETLPVLVHCSAGCGRTGTICAIDYVWGLLRLGKLTPDFSLYHLVRDMRRQRIAMVQTKDQYILVHRAVSELFQEQLKIIDAHPYANVDQNGLPLEIKAELQEPTYETIDYRHRDISGTKKSQPEPNCVGKSSAQEAIPPDSVPSDSTSSLSFPCKPSNSKLEKEVENHQKLQEQIRSKEISFVADQAQHTNNPPVITLSKQLSNDEGNIQQVEQQPSSATSVLKPASQPVSTKTSLLRKPSIIKLKAFFEKSKEEKEKKTGTTHLSRAKSDVSSSSRFYTSSSKSNSITPTAVEVPLQPPKTEKPESLSTHRKFLEIHKPKPMLLAKPTLPVKRSKSLKGHHVDSSYPNDFETRELRKEIRGGEPSSHLNSTNSSSSVVSTDPKNPIRVCVKQVEMPKLQKVVSKSIKLEAQQAKTTDKSALYCPEFQRNSSSQSVSSGSSSSQTIPKDQSKTYEEGKEKPQVPLRTHAQSLKLNHNYANVTYGTNRIKMGLAKEMEDVRELEQNSSGIKLTKIKKYETVNPKSIASGRTALTRSHSHVWQSDKVSLPIRIFSDENIHHAGSNSSHMVKPFHTNENSHSSKHADFSNQKPSATESFFNSLFTKSSIQNSSGSPSYAKAELKNPIYSAENPVVRRSVPKTNPYTNYPSGSPKRNSKIVDSVDSPQTFNEDSRIKECVPRLKSSHGNSLGNSSDSSSNAGTPRNSLPSTPTQSIDLLYSQLNKSHGGNGTDSNASSLGHPKGIPSGPPKSILKGSLSSTPSESDEKLDSGRSVLPNSNPVFSAPKLNTIRIAVGIRERRNSFRQAVWKEEQGNSPPKSNCVQPFQSVNSYQPVPSSSSIALQNGSVKTHKDYEPIWPESSSANSTFRLGNNKISDSSRMGLSSNQLSHPNTPSNDRRPNPQLKYVQDFSTSENNCAPKSKSRIDEIKGLLEELKAPMVVGSASGTEPNSCPPRNQHRPNNTAPGTSLKHQRSLRVPSKPQYQQSLSCFTFKKPSSYESITDHLHAEEYQPLVKPATSVFYGGSQNSQPEERLSNSFIENRQGNDYVVLGQCRTVTNGQSSSNGRGPTSSHSGGSSNFNHAPIPVPPPRTKRHQSSSPKRSNDFDDELRPAPLTIWMGGSQTGISSAAAGANGTEKDSGAATSDARNLTDEIREGSRPEEFPINSASPKAIIKALGLFQAKAANVRSRFINWSEAKDRQGKKPETGNEMPADFGENPRYEQNFEHSSQSGPQAGPSWSKHQYL